MSEFDEFESPTISSDFTTNSNMEFTYLIRFDENGRRCETYVKEEKTPKEVQELLDKGYYEIPNDIYHLLLGNVDGKEHIRNPVTGEYEVYVPPEPTPEEKYQMKDAEIRREREKLLSGTDYLLQPDYPLNDPESDQYNPEKIKEIKQFRQALRDITEQEDYPFIELPTLPAGIKLKDSYS